MQAILSLVVFYLGIKNLLIALGITQWVDGIAGALITRVSHRRCASLG